MNVNSMTNSSYFAQLQNNSKVQSQSGASKMAPSSSDYSALMQQVNTQVMSMLDTNQNGSVDKAEFSAAAKMLSQSKSLTSNTDNAFATMDTNNDGAITADELMKMLEELSTKKKAQKMSARVEESVKNQVAQATNETSKKQNLQSVLMKSILSAYGSGQSASTNSGLNLKA